MPVRDFSNEEFYACLHLVFVMSSAKKFEANSRQQLAASPLEGAIKRTQLFSPVKQLSQQHIEDLLLSPPKAITPAKNAAQQSSGTAVSLFSPPRETRSRTPAKLTLQSIQDLSPFFRSPGNKESAGARSSARPRQSPEAASASPKSLAAADLFGSPTKASARAQPGRDGRLSILVSPRKVNE